MSSKNTDGIVIKKYDPSMEDQVINLIKEDFFRDEPLCKSLSLKPTEPFVNYIKDALKMDASFVAIDTEANNKVIGVRLSGILRKEENKEHSNTSTSSTEKIMLIRKLLHTTFEQVDVFNKYNIEVILEGKMLSVHKDYRGREIAGRMMEATLDFMRESKIPLCYIPCTSFFTVRVLTKLGFESILKIPYEEYIVDGERVFYPEEPHKEFTVCIKLV